MLSFLGRGSAFSDEHNSAFFIDGEDLILIDLSMTSYLKVKDMDLSSVRHIYILITHTHGDHISGIAMLIDYEFFIGKIPVTVVAPSEEVEAELRHHLKTMEGCDDEWYELIASSSLSKTFFNRAIPTLHSPQLEGKCFGYSLKVDDVDIVYTGDTRTLEPFLPYLKPGSILYTETSAYKSSVHLYCEEIRETVEKLIKSGVFVYLMHLDDEEKIYKALGDTGAQLAPLYDSEVHLDEILDLCYNLYRGTKTNKSQSHMMFFENLTRLGKSLVGADRASFWRWDKRNHKLWTTSASFVDTIVIPDNTGLVGRALHDEEVIVTNDPYNHPDFNRDVDKKTGYVTKSILVLPVADMNGEYIGAFQLINKLNGPFKKEEDQRKLSLAAVMCGLALESDTYLDDALHDKLTKLKNRMGFYNDFNRNYNCFFEKDCDKKLSILMCDIDKFKAVNDTYGHNAGDAVLAKTASLLESFATDARNAYRWGGEEFIIILPDTDLEECVKIAEELRVKVMNTPIDIGEKQINKTISIGCHTFDKSLTIEENIEKADANLYQAKETGRNKVVY